MNECKLIKNLISLILFVSFIFIFTVGVVSYRLSIVSISFGFIVLISLIIYLGYKKYRKILDLKSKEIIKEYSQRGIILQNLPTASSQILNEIDRLKKELEVKENQITFMTTHSSQGLILINEKQEIIYVNQSGEEMIGLTNVKESSYIIRIRNQALKSQIEKSFIENKLYSEDYIINQRNLNIKTIPTSSKKSINILVVIDDLSEKINLQTTKKDFFNYAGHELKTPITILKGYAELIYHNIISGEETLEVAAKMIDQADLMGNFVEDMLMLSRLETYKDAPVIQVNLEERLKTVLSSLESFALNKNIILRSYSEPIIIKADPIDIDKMFKNLIENAIKYNYENGTVDIRLEKEQESILITIQNTGDGIDYNDIERIFERFYRVNQIRNIPGTGLGLSIVKHIINKYHGTIHVESKKFVYTRFSIKL